MKMLRDKITKTTGIIQDTAVAIEELGASDENARVLPHASV
jgi:hypothetical protein